MTRTPKLYPLSFKPIFKEKVWGGRRLQQTLGKPLPAAPAPIGESWELVDLPDDQSLVDAGALGGTTLHELVQTRGDELLGPVGLDGERFPLLVKYIDASQTLSVQVHPDGPTAARLGGRPKSEAWYILDAGPDAALYLCLEPGVDATTFRTALEQGEAERLVRRIPVRAGELYPVPPGTVHAIGAGVLLAEVQQPSDTTYRVHDWGRVGLDGRPRELHVEQALESIHFDATLRGPLREGTVDMELFQLELCALGQGASRGLQGTGPAVVVGLDGSARVTAPHGATACGRGDVVLVPHVERSGTSLVADSEVRALVVTFPPNGSA